MATAEHLPEIDECLDSLRLVDHHCHSVFTRGPDRSAFELALSESHAIVPGSSHFDSQLGFALLRWCSPVLGLDAHETPDAYFERRGSFGTEKLNRLFLGTSGVGRYLVDTGFPSDQVLSLAQLASVSEARCDEIVRLEQVADDVARTGIRASEFVEAFTAEFERRLAAGAVGTKSVAAYRYGLDLDLERPDPGEVRRAAGQWLAEIATTGAVRVSDPTLLGFLLWAGVDARVPLQVHVALGDGDLDLLRCNPLHLTPFIRLTEAIGTPILLLHCYPYHREAAYLAHIFPHVYFDVGLAVNLVGSQSRQIVAESLELAPFAKQLYSSDGWGIPELHFLGSRLWRQAMSSALASHVQNGDWSIGQALKVATMIGAGNAERLYGRG
jgi:predicted TIM-barrel fold metal-dependent hydrolase